MAVTLAEAAIKFIGDRTGLTKTLHEGEREGQRVADKLSSNLQRAFGERLTQRFQQLQTNLDNIARSASRTGTALSVGLSAPLLLVGAGLFKLASQVVATENLFVTSMGAMTDEARTWSQQLSKAFGLNEDDLRRMIATLNNMLVQMGVAPRAALEMGKALVELSFDLGTFFQQDPEEVFQKLQLGLAGNARGLKSLGVVMDETTLKQYAVNRGLIQQGQELSETGKIMARFGIITEATRNAQGNFARSLDQPATKLLIMRHQAKQAAEDFAVALLPAFQAVLADAKPLILLLGDLAKRFAALDPHTRQLIVRFGLVAIAVGPVLVGIGKIAGALSALIGFGGKFAPFASTVITGLAGIGGGAAAAAGRVGQLAAALRGLGAVSVLGAAAFVPFTNVAAARQRLLDIAQQDKAFAGVAKGLLAMPDSPQFIAQANQVVRAWERIHQAKTQDQKDTAAVVNANADLQAILKSIAAAGAAKPGAGKGLKDIPQTIDRIAEADRKMVEEAEAADIALKLRVQRYDEAYNAAVRIIAAEERLKELQEDRLAIIAAQPRERDRRDETGERSVDLIAAARQRLEELSTARSRNIDLIQREISQLQIIVEQEGRREQTLTDEDQIAEVRLNRLRAQADIEERLLEISRLRVDEARAILDLTQLEQSLGLATAAQVDAARRQALDALLKQLQTARDLNATQAELVPILQDILRLQEDMIRGDLLASWRQAIAELKTQTFDFLSGARQFFQDVQSGFASALRAFGTEGKTVLETLGDLARAVFDAAFTQVTNLLAQQLTQRLAGFMTQLFPALGTLGGAAGGASVAAAITASGTATAAAITSSGVSAATAITTSGVSLSTAITAAGTAMAAAITAAGAAAAAAIAAAAGLGAAIGIPGLQHGGLVNGPMVTALAEAGRPELVQPIPAGLSLREMAETMRSVAAGASGPITVQINNPVVRNDEDIHRIGRSVADALRMARRGNHPLFRENR